MARKKLLRHGSILIEGQVPDGLVLQRATPTGKSLNQLPKTRHSLILRLADAGNGEAWNEFVEVYERAIFRYAVSRGLQRADAEDVTQRVLEVVLAKSRSWDADLGGSFGAWLFRVTRNLAAKTWNERGRDAVNLADESGTAWLDEIPNPSEEEKTIFQWEYRKAVFHWAAERVRDQFREETWNAFWKSSVELQTAEQVATEMRIAKSAVYVAKCRVLARIKSEVRQFEQEFSHPSEIE